MPVLSLKESRPNKEKNNTRRENYDILGHLHKFLPSFYQTEEILHGVGMFQKIVYILADVISDK